MSYSPAYPAPEAVAPPGSRQFTTQRVALHPLAKASLLALVCPAFFELGPLLLNPSRLLFMIVAPILLVRLLLGAYGKLLVTDKLVLAYAGWITLTIAINNTNAALTFAGLNVASLIGGYLVARVTIRSVEDFLAFVRFFVWIILFLLPFAVYESLTTHMLLAELINAMPGFQSYESVGYGSRLGFYRAQVVFTHPIHFGLYCSMAVGLYFYGFANRVPLFKRAFLSALLVGTCFLSVSSGPLLATLYQLVLLGYGVLTHKNEKQWKYLLIVTGIVYAAIELVTTRFGLYAIAQKLALDSSTTFVRATLWEYGTAQIKRTPIFGVGHNPWPHPPWLSGSVDNFWLYTALIHGIPALILFSGLILYSMICAGHGKFRHGSDLYNIRVGWTIVLISLSLTLATVAIWSELLSMVLFVIGAGAFLFYVAEDSEEMASGSPGPERGQARYTRFPPGTSPSAIPALSGSPQLH